MPSVVSLLLSLFLAGANGPDGPASAELRQIVKEDQAIRQGMLTAKPSADVLKKMMEGDRARRKRVREIANLDQLVTPEDFDNAGLVFHHGEAAEDYFAGHEIRFLGTIGRFGSGPAVSEDRLVQKLGQRQRFGSQFSYSKDNKLIIEKLDEEPGFSVTDSLRLQYLEPPLAIARSKGIMDAYKAIEKPAEALMKRCRDPRWIRRMEERPEHAELERLAFKPDAPAAHKRVLELYHSDKLATASEFRHAAIVLGASRVPREILLAHEFAALAAIRGDKPALHLFATTLDRYLVSIGHAPRYGTIPGTMPALDVAPGVARRLGLLGSQP